MSKDDDKQIIDDFFEECGNDTVAEHNLGFGCSREITIDALYDIFVARMHMDKEFTS